MDDNEIVKERISKLKKEKDVAILAHYYVDGEVQKIADYVGDSFFLSKVATNLKQKNILFLWREIYGRKCKIAKSREKGCYGR